LICSNALLHYQCGASHCSEIPKKLSTEPTGLFGLLFLPDNFGGGPDADAEVIRGRHADLVVDGINSHAVDEIY